MAPTPSPIAVSTPNPNGVSFFINGTPHFVTPSDGSIGTGSRLVDYIRNDAGLTGTKFMCREGGCGACVVTARTRDPQTGETVVRAVNSCLAPVLSCDGWDISTVEDLGNKEDGYHPIQNRLANFGGSQCGFCTPGMVMNMYSLAESNTKLTSAQIEESFDGNICRCTGYRPILDAFKSFSVDPSEDIKGKCGDIEEIFAGGSGSPCNVTNKSECGVAKKLGRCCQDKPAALKLDLPTGEEWIKVKDLKSAVEAVTKFVANKQKYRVVAGNTGTGVFKYDGPYTAFLDINNVPDFKATKVAADSILIGGGNSLSFAIGFLKEVSTQDGFKYAAGMSHHIERVANLPVRNFASISGNLMMKHAHQDFPSDIFTIFETVGAKLDIASSCKSPSKLVSVADFLKLDMNGKIIVSLTLPNRRGWTYRSFKITKRHQNAHAYVNAGFMLKVDRPNNFKVLEKPSFTLGGISESFVHAKMTEEFLTGKELGDSSVLQRALAIFEQEVEPAESPPDATPEYRKSLARNLLYKVFLGILGNKLKAELRTGGEDLPHVTSSGKQNVNMSGEGTSALYKPVNKLEAAVQCSGEAEYVNDIEQKRGELFGAFVLSTVALANLKTLDPSKALKYPGVVKFLTAKDIPGKNDFYRSFAVEPDLLFVEKQITFAGQALGLIVAETREAASEAVRLVRVEYEDVRKPVLTIQDSLARAERNTKLEELVVATMKSPTSKPNPNSEHVIRGEFSVGSQAHFQMEPHVSLAVPKEDGFDIYAATQGTDQIQEAVTGVLNISANTINIEVRRLGGGYGGKFSRAAQPACAAALASSITRKPVRIVLDLETSMHMLGKRLPYFAKYEAGFDSTGKIDRLVTSLYCDSGSTKNDVTAPFAAAFTQNCYNVVGWEVTAGNAMTDTHPNTYCRAPGTTQGIAIIENIIEHIAFTLKKDPMEVRLVNLLNAGDPLLVPGKFSDEAPAEFPKFEGKNYIPDLLNEMKASAEYVERFKAVEEFNKVNRWRKRGMAVVPMRYHQGYHGMCYPSYVAIYQIDGTVAVSHGGIEMGQGINTKVAQTVSHVLGIPMDKVQIKPTNTLVAANAFVTGGAITSELVCYATKRACEALLERIKPVQEKMTNNNKPPSWEEVIKACYYQGIDLRATHLYSGNDAEVKGYDIWALNLTEVEVDVLTGEFKIARLDIIEDAGQSLSPAVDIGQVEGSVVMGLGLWTKERLVFDQNTGRLLTNNSWEYKVPLPMCIPEDFRVSFMRNAPNPFGVLRSKATGEPPICTAVSVLFAIRHAIASARKDAGNTDWFQLDGPVTPEDIVRLSLISSAQLVF